MRKILVYLLIFISPFLFIVFVNEFTGYRKPEFIDIKAFNGIEHGYALNSSNFNEKECNWSCHNNGCKHKSIVNKGFIKKMYFGIIDANKSKSLGYKFMSVFVLAFLIPIGIYILIILNIEIYLKRRKL